MDSTAQQQNILDKRKAERSNAIRKLKLLIGAGVGLLVLFLIILIASFREGGFSNLLKGESNVVVNTIENVGSSFIGNDDEDDPSTYNIPVKVTTAPAPIDEQTVNEFQNEVIFDEFSTDYSIKVKNMSYIFFINNTGSSINIKIDGLDQVALEDGESKNIRVARIGTFAFRDLLDDSPMQIRGTIEVVE